MCTLGSLRAPDKCPEKLDREIEQLELRLEELQILSNAAYRRAAEHEETTQARCAGRCPSICRASAWCTSRRAPARTAGSGCARIGEDVSEVLDYVPGHFKVIRHVRPKLACPACERIVQVAAPSRPIERGFAGPGLLAHV